MNKIDKASIQMIEKRLYDIAACNPKLKIWLNGDPIIFKSFKEYAELYTTPIFYEQSENWQIGIGHSTIGFKAVSFVNSVETKDGGTHVNNVTWQITQFLRDKIKRKYRVDVKPNELKNHLYLYINCTVINQAYSSQTKEKLITELIKSIEREVATKHKQKNQEQRKIYIAGGNHKCIKPNQNTLEIRNLDLKYGNSTTDRGATSININISVPVNNPYTLIVSVTGSRNLPIFATPMTIMIPRSIFILDLSNLVNVKDDELEYVLNSFKNSSNNKSYFKTFIEYILSFADNLTKGDIDNTQVFVTQTSANNLKVIGL